MILWLNGPHGVGKSSVARHIVRAERGVRLIDPEAIGHRLRRELGEPTPDDFKDLPEWRARTVAALSAAREKLVVVPMTLSDPQHFEEVIGTLRRGGADVRHVTLMARPETVRARIGKRWNWPRAKRWALARVEGSLAALAGEPFAPHVWTDGIGIPAVADAVTAEARLFLVNEVG